MESDRTSNTSLSDCARGGLQRARPSHGRTSGPTRRSTKGQWTAEEDEILQNAVERFKGKNWKKIAECFKDRTDVQCLHRWQKVLNPELVKGPWSKEEDEIIIECVNKYGPKKWSTIAQHLPGRIGKQCRERWHNHLNPGINKEAWTQDEELALIRAHQIYGNKWAELTKFLPGRTDNSIKNHWNSSVRKKLDTYLASGLLSQFQGGPPPPLVIRPNDSAASSSSKALQNSEDGDSATIKDETEDISECSMSQPIITTNAHPGEESSSVPCSEDYYRPSFEEATFSVPAEVPPCELNTEFLEHDFSIDWGAFSGRDWPLNPNDIIPDMSSLDLGQESSNMFLNHELAMVPPNSAAVGPENVINGSIDGGPADLLFQIPENGNFSSQSCYMMPPDMPGNSFTQSLQFDDQYNYSSNGNTGHEESNEQQESQNLVQANDFILPTPKEDSSEDKNPVIQVEENEEEKEDSGALFYEPPRFPSLDIPFFSCDLAQSGNDNMQQEYSPLGIRQLMLSSSMMTPFKMWDSPSRDDINNSCPQAVLKSAAKTFTGTPSILKKRSRDLLSPLSEKRGPKKLESVSNTNSKFSRLEVMFDECFDENGELRSSSPKKERNSEESCIGKENAGTAENNGKESALISECKMPTKELNGIGGTDAMEETVKELSGILVEHDTNDMLFFSPDRFGIKSDKSNNLSARALENQYLRRLDVVSRNGAIASSSSETSSFSVVCSPRLSTNRDGTNLFGATSLQPSSPSDKKAESSGKGAVASENTTLFVETPTPFKRSIGSPSPWKSPWFINTFAPGPRVDTDISIEDMGYFLSPGDRSYDALGLMKQLGEQTADTFADAQEVLGDETPHTIMKGKCSVNMEGDRNSPAPSNFMAERRTLDFSECETPRKESGISSSSGISFSSPSSYLLKGCR